jgi:hypothetical protein
MRSKTGTRQHTLAYVAHSWPGTSARHRHASGQSGQGDACSPARPIHPSSGVNRLRWTAVAQSQATPATAYHSWTGVARNAPIRPPPCCHGAFPTGRKSLALMVAVHAWQLAAPTVNDVLPSLRRLWVRVPRGPQGCFPLSDEVCQTSHPPNTPSRGQSQPAASFTAVH